MSALQRAVTELWSKESRSYDAFVRSELGDGRRQAWLRQFAEHRPGEGPIDILDAGTGPGFFPILLAGQGHRIHGIDVAEPMLERARAHAASAGLVGVSFTTMDSHHLDFPADSFDLVLARNATWLLHDPVAAYREWLRVLRPGGRLVVFDADYMTYLHFPDQAERYAADQERALAAGYLPPRGEATGDAGGAARRVAESLPLTRERRPAWDVPVLLELGFRTVFVDRDISAQVHAPIERIRYASTPLFAIRAER